MGLFKKDSPVVPDSTSANSIIGGVKLKVAPMIDLWPVVSEKATRLQALGQYMFKVQPGVSKIMIKKAVEVNYHVQVVGVNSVRLPRKTLRRGRKLGRTRIRRHMIVRLAKGQTINLLGKS